MLEDEWDDVSAWRQAIHQVLCDLCDHTGSTVAQQG